MVERRPRRSVDRSRYRDYRTVADHLREAAGATIEFEYWTAAGVLIVHAAIAYADALCIKFSGQRSISIDHEDAVGLLDEVVNGGEEKKRALNDLRRIIEEKSRVSYLGVIYTAADVHAMWKRLVRFTQWAVTILAR